MRKLVFFSVLAFLLLPLSQSFGFSEKGQDCSKCHTLSKDEAAALLKEFGQGLKILDVAASPMKGMWEVDVEANGRKVPVYIDFSKRFMVSGAIISLKEKKNLTQERLEEINKVDVAQIPLGDALIMGDKNAKHKIIVFDDPA